MASIKKVWKTVEVNAANRTLGRVATEVARILIGKHRPDYSPEEIGGDTVKVFRVKDIAVPKSKMESKLYRHHSGYPGGLKTSLMKDVWAKSPAMVLKIAVRRMLPDNRLRDRRMKRLNIE